jgi:hypothetical protein
MSRIARAQPSSTKMSVERPSRAGNKRAQIQNWGKRQGIVDYEHSYGIAAPPNFM